MKTVYVSKALKKRHPAIFDAITLSTHWEFGGCPTNIWIRDYMPVPTSKGLVKFQYKTVGCDKWSQLKVPKSTGQTFNPIVSSIVLDGGNVVQGESHVLVTQMLLRQNPYVSCIYDQLEELFGKQLVVIPIEPGDTLGHADGIVAFIDSKRVLINNYSVMKDGQMDRYQSKLTKVLENAGLSVSVFPYAYHKCPHWPEKQFRQIYPHADDMNPAVGYYLNFLHLIDQYILLPQFAFDEDADAVKCAKKYFPEHIIVPINCFDLAMTGGLLHCVTWEH